MPIYEYICQDCGLKFEHLVYGEQRVVCPDCNNTNLRKLISTFAFNSKDTQGNITSSSAGCGSCVSHNCSACGR